MYRRVPPPLVQGGGGEVSKGGGVKKGCFTDPKASQKLLNGGRGDRPKTLLNGDPGYPLKRGKSVYVRTGGGGIPPLTKRGVMGGRWS